MQMAMHSRENIGAITAMIGVAERPWAPMRGLRTWVAAIMLSATLLSGAAAAPPGSAAARSSGQVATPPQIAELMALLADPKVRDWLERQHAAEASRTPAPDAGAKSVSHYFETRLGATREHIAALAAALPDLPSQFERAVGRLRTEIPTRGTVPLLVLVFAASGFGVEWLFRKATQKTRLRLDRLPMDTVHDRLRLIVARFAFAFVVAGLSRNAVSVPDTSPRLQVKM